MLVVCSRGYFVASTPSDSNLVGGSLHLKFVEENDAYFIDDVRFEPHLIHYEEEAEGDISTRTNFEIFELNEYPDELAERHALNNFEDNIISVENYQNIVEDVIDVEFLE